jgi:hypothetical protein
MIEKVLAGGTYGGAATAVVGGLTVNEYVAIGGLVIAVCSFAVNVYYKRKHYRLAEKKLVPE